tara:strand:- start:1530 stop:1703 length:174 start_codon:yes stop_codon:yes gene_type:complete
MNLKLNKMEKIKDSFKKGNKVQYTFAIDPKVLEKCKANAKKDGRSFNNYIENQLGKL